MQAIQKLKAKFKGASGERKVKKVINNNSNKNTYVINDYITEKDGKTSQIDHIVIRPQGIEVVETKNYNGTIYGKKDEKSWTSHYGHKKNYKMQNPINQNQGHCQAIKDIIGKDVPIQNTVVFTGKGNISSVSYDNVYSLEEYKAKCKKSKTDKNQKQKINPKEIYQLLQENNPHISSRQHVKNLKKRQIKSK